MDNEIDKMDEALADASAKIGSKCGADASAIIILKGKGSRIYCSSPGKGEPTNEEASKVLRKMGEAFIDRANQVASGGKFEEATSDDKPDLSQN